MVEGMLAARGIAVSHETVRQWGPTFGQAFANQIGRKLPGSVNLIGSGRDMEPIRPSVCRNARRNTARKVKAVRIARGEYQGCPPRVVRGSAAHASTASSVNHTVRLPRWRRLAS